MGPLLVLTAGPGVARDEAFTITDPRVTESSGLARSRAHPHVVWTVNDSGDRSLVYAIDTRTGATVGVHDYDAEVRDVEAVAVGADGTMYVADIGDNRRVRQVVRVYSFPEPALGETSGTGASWELAYPDGAHDAETFLVDPVSGAMVVLAKGQDVGVYALPARPTRRGVNQLSRVGDAPAVATDGVWRTDGQVVVRGYLLLWVLDPATWQVRAQSLLPPQPQGESIATGDQAGTVLVGSEGRRSLVLPVAVPVAASGTSSPPAATTPSARTSDPSSALLDRDRVAQPAWPLVPVAATGALVGLVLLVSARRRRQRSPR